MSRDDSGYFTVRIDGVSSGDRYTYVLNDTKERPDPVSRFQPDGVHGASVLVDPEAFVWSDADWRGLPLERLIVYELHVGACTAEGTFAGLIPRLSALKDLGVTAIELMPVAQFPGARNWGYDGVYLYAPQSTYGGPDGLKTFVDACHRHGLAVILDVVYNHLGPEGNYLDDFGPYFTDRYRTPWGRAVNYDGPDSDEVRRFVVDNARYWITEYHMDGLRLDAIHGIYDFGAMHILRELAEAVHEQGRALGRTVLVIGESDLNDVRVITPPTEGGYGLDAQWSDDFHHALHAVLTGERAGYYEDFGKAEQLATALQDGFVYSGQHSRHRRRRHGNSSRGRPPQQLIICTQNHDQIGNRAWGERLTALVPWEALKVAAAALLLAPQTPLLFMGEEYGETAPFQYFVDHGDPGLIEAVRQGRRREFAAFGWTDVPDPFDKATFERSRLQGGAPHDDRQRALLAWYRRLIALRSRAGPFGPKGTHAAWVDGASRILILHRFASEHEQALVLLNLRDTASSTALREPTGSWRLGASSWSEEFGGGAAVESATHPNPLQIRDAAVSVLLPAYGVAVYLADPLEVDDR